MFIRFLTAAIMAAYTACAAVSGNAGENIYADCGVIMEEPEKTQDDFYKVTFTLQNGHRFSFESEDGDWTTGDIVSAIFNDKGTPYVFDDEIIDEPTYSGWISEEEMQNWIK